MLNCFFFLSVRHFRLFGGNNYNLGKVIFINNLKLFNNFPVFYQTLVLGIKNEAAKIFGPAPFLLMFPLHRF